MIRRFVSLCFLASIGLLLSCGAVYLPLIVRGGSTPSPGAPSASPTPSKTATLIPSATPTSTPTNTETTMPSATPTPTNTASPTASHTPTFTRTATATRTPANTPTATPGPTLDELIDALDGIGQMFSHDGQTYLGRVSSNCYLYDSIVNKFGPYGSPYSQTSISNPFGPYGSPFSNTSAFNQFASEPPAVWVWINSQWMFVAPVTINPFTIPRIPSDYLLAYLRLKGGCSP